MHSIGAPVSSGCLGKSENFSLGRAMKYVVFCPAATLFMIISTCSQAHPLSERTYAMTSIPSRASTFPGFVALLGASSPIPNSPFAQFWPQAMVMTEFGASSGHNAKCVVPPEAAEVILQPMISGMYRKDDHGAPLDPIERVRQEIDEEKNG